MTEKENMEEAKTILAQAIYLRGNQLTSEDLEKLVDKFQPVYQFTQEEATHLKKFLETQYVTTMGAGVSLIDPDIPHDEEWFLKRAIEWDYWNDYEKHLISYGWPTRVVSSMNSVTDKILGPLPADA